MQFGAASQQLPMILPQGSTMMSSAGSAWKRQEPTPFAYACSMRRLESNGNENSLCHGIVRAHWGDEVSICQ